MKKNIIIAIVIIVVAVVVYFGFIKEDFAADSLLGTTSATSSSNILGKDIARALNEIGTLSLDTSIFNKPSFQVLVDYKQTIPLQDPGRVNPFLPVTAQEPNSDGIATINVIGDTPGDADLEGVDDGQNTDTSEEGMINTDTDAPESDSSEEDTVDGSAIGETQ